VDIFQPCYIPSNAMTRSITISENISKLFKGDQDVLLGVHLWLANYIISIKPNLATEVSFIVSWPSVINAFLNDNVRKRLEACSTIVFQEHLLLIVRDQTVQRDVSWPRWPKESHCQIVSVQSYQPHRMISSLVVFNSRLGPQPHATNF
jgi:hypothetical protein